MIWNKAFNLSTAVSMTHYFDSCGGQFSFSSFLFKICPLYITESDTEHELSAAWALGKSFLLDFPPALNYQMSLGPRGIYFMPQTISRGRQPK